MTAARGSLAEGLRVAIFSETYAPQINGVSVTLERLVGAIEARGGEAHVVTADDPAAAFDARVERWPSIPFWAYPQLKLSAPARNRALDAIERWKPTLIHAATQFGVGLSGLIGARERRVPFVSSYHTHYPTYLRHYRLNAFAPIAWPYLRWFHNSGRLTWTPSGFIAHELRSHGFTNVRVWSRGVDPARFSPSFRSRALRERLGAGDDTILVTYVGRLAPEKGIDVALDGMRRVLERNAGRVVFALAGDGPAEARFRAAAPPGAVFQGRLTGRDLSEFYASADVFVFPSITETFGNVVLEAMASGLALVAPDWGATTELATTDTALQFSAHDPGALAERVERLVMDEPLRRRLADSALSVARTQTWDAVFDTLVADYRDAVTQQSTA